MKKLFLFLLLNVAFYNEGLASHIVGGEITYRRLATIPGGARFEVTLKIYRDSSSGVNFDPSILVGVFERNTNTRIDSIQIDSTQYGKVTLIGSLCLTPPQFAVDYYLYTDTIELSNNLNGYYLMWERCCRNSTVVNIKSPDDTGIAFYCEMPDPSIINNSPKITNEPFPFMCEGQPFVYDFSATDADGDLLTYELATPYAGFLGFPTNPTPQAVASVLNPGPYPLIQWQNGYSLANVCNSAVPLTVNAGNGELSVKADLQGIYSVAVLVRETRAGVQIGLIRREIQFNVITCNQNAVPQISYSNINSANPNAGNGVPSNKAVTFEIYETDSLCFSLNVTDNDTLTITYSGDVFAGSGITPPFATTTNAQGTGTIQTGFCWTTNCNHSRSTPYRVIYRITDTGCPLPYDASDTVFINVLPIPQITGAELLCMETVGANSLKINYSNTFSISRFFKHYLVYRSVSGNAFAVYDTINAITFTDYTDINAPNNLAVDYCYYFVGYNTCNEVGIPSDTLCSVAALADKTNYLVTATVINNEEVQLDWQHFPNGAFSTFYFQRKAGDNDGYNSYLTLNNPVQDSIIDVAVNVQQSYYCYKLTNEDYCGRFSPESNEACTILLQGSALPLQNKLNWTAYKQWAGGVAAYELWRSSSSSSFTRVATLPANVLEYIDNDISGISGTFNYYVIAKEGSGSFDAQSRSNEIVVEQQPSVFIPSAFTPNNDGVNDKWFTVTTFIKDYDLSVFNRWGNLVFRSNNPLLKWDGSDAPQGTYLYMLKYTGFDDASEKIITGQLKLLR